MEIQTHKNQKHETPSKWRKKEMTNLTRQKLGSKNFCTCKKYRKKIMYGKKVNNKGKQGNK